MAILRAMRCKDGRRKEGVRSMDDRDIGALWFAFMMFLVGIATGHLLF